MNEHDARCPTCNLAWWLFHPVAIAQTEAGPAKVRCIECKDVFLKPDWLQYESPEVRRWKRLEDHDVLVARGEAEPL